LWESPVSNAEAGQLLSGRGVVRTKAGEGHFNQGSSTNGVKGRQTTMGKNNKDTHVVYRDSKTGEFLTQRQAERKDPATWEREHVKNPTPKK